MYKTVQLQSFDGSYYWVTCCVSQLELPMSRVRDVILGGSDATQQQFALCKWNFLHRVVCSCVCWFVCFLHAPFLMEPFFKVT